MIPVAFSRPVVRTRNFRRPSAHSSPTPEQAEHRWWCHRPRHRWWPTKCHSSAYMVYRFACGHPQWKIQYNVQQSEHVAYTYGERHGTQCPFCQQPDRFCAWWRMHPNHEAMHYNRDGVRIIDIIFLMYENINDISLFRELPLKNAAIEHKELTRKTEYSSCCRRRRSVLEHDYCTAWNWPWCNPSGCDATAKRSAAYSAILQRFFSTFQCEPEAPQRPTWTPAAAWTERSMQNAATDSRFSIACRWLELLSALRATVFPFRIRRPRQSPRPWRYHHHRQQLTRWIWAAFLGPIRVFPVPFAPPTFEWRCADVRLSRRRPTPADSRTTSG